MSRKHFQAIAASLAAIRPKLSDFGPAYENEYECQLGQWRADVMAMVGVCRQFNSNFNQSRFLEACNYEN